MSKLKWIGLCVLLERAGKPFIHHEETPLLIVVSPVIGCDAAYTSPEDGPMWLPWLFGPLICRYPSWWNTGSPGFSGSGYKNRFQALLITHSYQDSGKDSNESSLTVLRGQRLAGRCKPDPSQTGPVSPRTILEYLVPVAEEWQYVAKSRLSQKAFFREGLEG